MEQSEFKIRYIRLNEPCRIVIQDIDALYDYKFNIGEAYFKEYNSTFDIFFIIDEEVKLYLKAINMQKSTLGDNTVMFHMNALKSGYYKITANSMRKRLDGLVDIRRIDKLEEDIYGKQ